MAHSIKILSFDLVAAMPTLLQLGPCADLRYPLVGILQVHGSQCIASLTFDLVAAMLTWDNHVCVQV